MKQVLWFCWLMLGCAAAAEKVSVEKAEALIDRKIQLVDVRTEKEWQKGCLEGAVRVDYQKKDFAAQIRKAADPEKPVLLYCHSGGRSARAAKEMEKLGYKVVYDLKGGIVAWKEADKLVVK